MNQLFLVYYCILSTTYFTSIKNVLTFSVTGGINACVCGLFSIMKMTSLIINKNKDIYLYKREGKGYITSLFHLLIVLILKRIHYNQV